MNTQSPIPVRIKRFDKELPLPARHSSGAACFDMYSRLTVAIEPGSFGYLPLNVAVEIPEGYWMMLAARSSTHKTGLIPANGHGILDHDFRGDNDEIVFIVYNGTNKPVTVERGARIAQVMVLPVLPVALEEVDHLGNIDRGGIGSTGNR